MACRSGRTTASPTSTTTRAGSTSGTKVGDQGRVAATAQSGEVPGITSGTEPNRAAAPTGPPYDDLVKSLLKPPPQRDDTLQDPRCVFQIVKRHFSRYTPEMVERTTGCPRDTFLNVADTILANSGADRTTSFAYAVAWTQHTNGPQIIGCCALLQLLLGNFGRPGAGIMALRGHASIQGSTDVPTLYHSIHGYMPAPTALKKHDTLSDYLTAETVPTGYYANTPKFVVSYLKSMYGDAATRENDFGYAWHPKIIGDHSHLPMFVAMNEGKVKGMLCVGQNPATSLNAKLERAAMRKLEWLVVKDNWLQETGTLLEDRAGSDERRSQASGHQDRSLLLSGGAGGRNAGHVYEHSADAADPFQGGRGARRLYDRRLVHLPARANVSRSSTPTVRLRAIRDSRIWCSTTSTMTPRNASVASPTPSSCSRR